MRTSAVPRRPAATPHRRSTDADDVRRLGLLASLLLIGGWASVLATLPFFEPGASAGAYPVATAGIAAGFGCALLPWRRLSPRWLHGILVAAGGEIAVAMLTLGNQGAVYWRFYVITAAFAALAFSSRRAILAHLLYQSALLVLVAGVLSPDTGSAALGRSLLGVPQLLMVAVLIAYLRERLEEREAMLRRLAARDALTGVGNYRMLQERLARLIEGSATGVFALFVLDIDRFKAINDAHGHVRGDTVLRAVGDALRGVVRDEDTVVRQGGDEFAVIAPRSGTLGAPAMARRITSAVAAVQVDGVPLGASIGWALYPRDGRSADALLTAADAAQLAAKAGRRVGREADAAPAGAADPEVSPAASA